MILISIIINIVRSVFLLILTIINCDIWDATKLFITIFIIATVCLLIGLSPVFFLFRAFMIIAIGLKCIIFLFSHFR